jgi:hypothetical protein
MTILPDTGENRYTVFENLQNEALNKAPQGDHMEPTWIFRENNIFPQIIFTGFICASALGVFVFS